MNNDNNELYNIKIIMNDNIYLYDIKIKKLILIL